MDNLRPFFKKTSVSLAVFNLKKETHIVLFRNEQYYEDIVHILELNTNSLNEAYHQAVREVSEEKTFHIGETILPEKDFLEQRPSEHMIKKSAGQVLNFNTNII